MALKIIKLMIHRVNDEGAGTAGKRRSSKARLVSVSPRLKGQPVGLLETEKATWKERVVTPDRANKLFALWTKLRSGRAKLETLLRDIEERRKKIRKKDNESVYLAYENGKCLRRIKKLLKHGEYKKWVAYEFGVSPTTAKNWKRIADPIIWRKRILPRLRSAEGLTYKAAVDATVDNRKPKDDDARKQQCIKELTSRIYRRVSRWDETQLVRLSKDTQFLNTIEEIAAARNQQLTVTMPEVEKEITRPDETLSKESYPKVRRTFLLEVLESVAGGLDQSTRNILQQSDSFIFRKGEVITYNEEVSCRKKININIRGAVPADELLTILRNSDDREFSISGGGKAQALILSSGQKEFQLSKENKIELAVEQVEKPSSWTPLQPAFMEAIARVLPHYGTDETKFILTCLHIHPHFIEATNNREIMRVQVNTGVPAPLLIRGSNLKRIINLSFAETSLTENWIHFRDEDGLTCSLLAHKDPYPELDEILNDECPDWLTLPSNLVAMCNRASVVGCDAYGEKCLRVKLEKGRMRIEAQWRKCPMKYSESTETTYGGPDSEFIIDSVILRSIAERYSEVQVSERMLKAIGTDWTYVARLGNEVQASDSIQA